MWLSDRAIRREFPPLEILSAADLERLVGQARSSLPRWRRTAIMTRAAGEDAVLCGAALFFIVLVLALLGGFASSFAGGLAVLVLVAALPVVLIVKSGRELERRAVRERLVRPCCSSCRYSLKSLPAPGGRMCCPECGEQQWVRPTESAQGREDTASEPACCLRCGYSLVGLPEHEGRVMCPECGRDQSVPACSSRARWSDA